MELFTRLKRIILGRLSKSMVVQWEHVQNEKHQFIALKEWKANCSVSWVKFKGPKMKTRLRIIFMND